MRAHRTHYLKWVLTEKPEEISVRYFFLFEDRKHLEGKYVLKNHHTGNIEVISEEAAKMILQSRGIDFDDFEEIYGVAKEKRYIKTTITPDGSVIISKEDV